MKLQKNKQYIDRFYFHWRSKAPPHDIKENVRKNSIFDDIKIHMNVIYNWIFICFIKNIGINKSYINSSNFCEKLGMPKTTPDSIIKPFRKLRDCIRQKYHKRLNNEQMRLEPDIKGVSRLEIETKV